MGVYIKGMEMPTDCALMLKIFPDGRVGVPVHLNWCGTMVVNDAEAIPVPAHGRLIDADALANQLDFTIKHCTLDGHAARRNREMIVELSVAPAIIPAEEGRK